MRYADVLRFIGLNFDDSALVFQPGDYKDALNIRIANTMDPNAGAAEKIKGNNLVANSLLPAGTNTTIGALEDRKGKTIIFFNHNSNGNHCIFRYYQDISIIRLVLKSSILNFDLDHLITGVDLIDDLLYWTDHFNPPRKINLLKAQDDLLLREFDLYVSPNDVGSAVTYTLTLKDPANVTVGSPFTYNRLIGDTDLYNFVTEFARSYDAGAGITDLAISADNGHIHASLLNNSIGAYTVLFTGTVAPPKVVAFNFYPTPFIERYIDAAKYPPLYPPKPGYITGTAKKTDLVKDRVFQFRARYIYDDNEKSAWGPISIIPINNTFNTAFNKIQVDLQQIDLSTDLTDKGVLAILKHVELAVRERNTGQWKSVVVLDIEDFGFQTTYSFYNDGVYIPISATETNEPFDSIPQLAKSQKIVDNRLFYGGTTEDYDPVPISAKVEVTYPGTSYPTENRTYFKRGWDGQFGIIYYDRALRDGGANTHQGLKKHINFYTEKNPATGNMFPDGPPVLNWTIYNLPPNWATHYQWVRTKSMQVNSRTQFQFVTSSFGDSLAEDYLLLPVTITPGANSFSVGGDYTFIFGYVGKKFSIEGSAAADGNYTVQSGSFTGGVYTIISNEAIPGANDVATLVVNANDTIGLKVDGVPDDCTVIWFELTNGYNKDKATAQVTYTYEQGDRIRFIKKYDGVLFDDYYDFEIVKYIPFYAYTKESLALSVFSTSGVAYEGVVIKTSDFNQVKVQIAHGTETYTADNGTVHRVARREGALFEIYNPKKVDSTFTYWEYGECFEIGDGVNGKYHKGPTQNQDPLNPVTTPATGTFSTGDVYYRKRLMPVVEAYYHISNDYLRPVKPGVTRGYDLYIDDPRIFDFHPSNDEDIGRPNLQNTNRKRLFEPSKLRFSSIYIPGTKINGLSTFNALNEKLLNRDYGLIQRLVLIHDSELVALCENSKTVSMPIGKSLFKDVAGQQVVAITDSVISATTGLRGSFGTMNPESVGVSDSDDIYFWDANKGVAVRYASNGLFPISEYKAKIHFRKLNEKLQPTAATNKIYGVVDRGYNEYIPSFAPVSVLSFTGETIAFNESINRWTSRYSYQPEYMAVLYNQMVAFKGGNLYEQNKNTLYNYFFGVQYSSRIRTVSKIEELKLKIWNAIAITANAAWKCLQANTPPNASYPNGMTTTMDSTQFRLKEGKFYCEFNRNTNTPNVTDPIVNGNVMRSQTIEIEMENTDTSAGYIFDVEVVGEYSEKS